MLDGLLWSTLVSSGVIVTIAVLLIQIPANSLMAQEINETNLNLLFNSADYCLSIISTADLLLQRYDCCNAVEQTWEFINTLDLTGFSPELQAHASNLYNQILPLTEGPLGVGKLGPIIDGVAQGCIVPCDTLVDPTCTRLP